KIRFDQTDRERTFDFAFQDVTREPVPTTRMASAGSPSSSSDTNPRTTTAIGNPVVVATDPLPTTTAGLIAELTRGNREIETLIGGGDLGGVWVPAMRSKDIAL